MDYFLKVFRTWCNMKRIIHVLICPVGLIQKFFATVENWRGNLVIKNNVGLRHINAHNSVQVSGSD